jgi:ribosomal-protein-serine acetyltransferase
MNIAVDENINLELTSQNHAAPLFDLVNHNRKHLSQFLPWVDNMKTVNDFKDYIQNCELLYRQKKEVSFVIMLNDKPVGRIGLHHLNLPNKIGAIGYWLGANFQNQGIITRSCKTLINYGFQQLNLNRIEIKAAVDNVKSQGIPIKLNFKKEGILRQSEFVNNQFIDLVLYSMLKNEWHNEQ